MGFVKKNKGKNDSRSIPGSLGTQIKKYRELRDYSMKELGRRCGFAAPSADVRISEYETNKTVPNEKSLQDLTEALELDKDTLHGTSSYPFGRLRHDLFVLEELYGLHPEYINGGYCLTYDPQHDGCSYASEFYWFLQDWYKMYEQCKTNGNMPADKQEERRKKYVEWKGIYPSRFDDDARIEMEDQFLVAELNNNADSEVAKYFTEKRLLKFDEDMNEVISDFRINWKPIKKESDFTLIIMKAMENGLRIYKGSPQMYPSYDFGSIDLFSIKISDILSSDENKRLYAEIFCGVHTLNKARINVTRRVTAYGKETYLSFSCSQLDMSSFGDITLGWDRICRIVGMKNDKSVPKEESLKAEEEFLADIRDPLVDRELKFI